MNAEGAIRFGFASHWFKNWRRFKLDVAIAYLLSTLIHVTFQHGIALNSQRLPNSTFNIQLTNCTKKEKKQCSTLSEVS